MDLIRAVAIPMLRPLSVSLVLLVLGVALLWLKRKPRLARALLTTGTLTLLLASVAPVPMTLLRSLEDDHPAYAPQQGAVPEWIVVLCGGAEQLSGRPALSGLSTHTLIRLVEGVRIARLHPEARLLLTGGGPAGVQPCSAVIREAAAELGVVWDRVTIDTASRTTEDEAVAVERLVGDVPFVLVTSASHLPRAMALMRARGLDPVPAPAGPRAGSGSSPFRGLFRPDAEHLVTSDLWAHEVIGRLWSRVRGRI